MSCHSYFVVYRWTAIVPKCSCLVYVLLQLPLFYNEFTNYAWVVGLGWCVIISVAWKLSVIFSVAWKLSVIANIVNEDGISQWYYMYECMYVGHSSLKDYSVVLTAVEQNSCSVDVHLSVLLMGKCLDQLLGMPASQLHM